MPFSTDFFVFKALALALGVAGASFFVFGSIFMKRQRLTLNCNLQYRREIETHNNTRGFLGLQLKLSRNVRV